MKRRVFVFLFFWATIVSFNAHGQLTFSLPNCNSADEQSYFSPDQISACYNPQTDVITVELKEKKNPSENYRVELYSVLGLPVYDKSYSKSSLIDIPVKDFKKGMYVIVVSDDKNSVKKRILVN